MPTKIRLEHVISFSDAIFAFSITFMAISIQIPNLPENLTQTQIIDRIVGELGLRFTVYVISFFVIGAYWISYHQIFNHIAGSHGIIVWLNLAFLFFITLIPFAVDLEVDYSSYHIIFILYAVVLTAAGLSLTLIWLYASKNRLVDKTMNHTEKHHTFLESALLPSVFVISILVSVIDLQAAFYFWLVIIPAKIIIRKKYGKAATKEEEVE
jgi:TMEM175 potassium channel family protein